MRSLLSVTYVIAKLLHGPLPATAAYHPCKYFFNFFFAHFEIRAFGEQIFESFSTQSENGEVIFVRLTPCYHVP